MIQTGTKKLTLAAMFFAIGIILPFFIGQIPLVGQMLLPMHIPVLLCGLIVGWQYGLATGFFLPLVRGMLFGMPALFPNGIGMAFEMATYGLVIGYLYSHSRWPVYQIPVPLSHCGNDRRKTGLGSSTCGTSWHERYRIFMGTVYGRRADQCHSWYCAAADPDPDDHGSFEQSEDRSL